MINLSPTILVSASKIVLMATFAASLAAAIRGEGSISTSFERMIIGLLGISFYQQADQVFESSSNALAQFVSSVTTHEDLRAFVLEGLKRASEEKAANGSSTVFNIPAYVEQLWRTGVWGVVTTIVDFFFLLVSTFLTLAKDVLSTLLLVLFPVGAALYPIFPRIMSNLCLYRLELAFWLPILNLIEATSVMVSKKYLNLQGSLGLYLTAVEIIVILLILSIPSITHRFLSGAFSGDFESQALLRGAIQRINSGSRMVATKVAAKVMT